MFVLVGTGIFVWSSEGLRLVQMMTPGLRRLSDSLSVPVVILQSWSGKSSEVTSGILSGSSRVDGVLTWNWSDVSPLWFVVRCLSSLPYMVTPMFKPILPVSIVRFLFVLKFRPQTLNINLRNPVWQASLLNLWVDIAGCFSVSLILYWRVTDRRSFRSWIWCFEKEEKKTPSETTYLRVTPLLRSKRFLFCW